VARWFGRAYPSDPLVIGNSISANVDGGAVRAGGGVGLLGVRNG